MYDNSVTSSWGARAVNERYTYTECISNYVLRNCVHRTLATYLLEEFFFEIGINLMGA